MWCAEVEGFFPASKAEVAIVSNENKQLKATVADLSDKYLQQQDIIIKILDKVNTLTPVCSI
jgi:hypothetical protein